MIYIDANVLYSYLFETPMSESAEIILGYSNKVTSRTVVNEAIYVTFRRLARDKGVKNVHDVKKFAKTEEGRIFLNNAYSLVMELIGLSETKLADEEEN